MFCNPEGPAGLPELHQVLQAQRHGGSGATAEGAGGGRPEGGERAMYMHTVGGNTVTSGQRVY